MYFADKSLIKLQQNPTLTSEKYSSPKNHVTFRYVHNYQQTLLTAEYIDLIQNSLTYRAKKYIVTFHQ